MISNKEIFFMNDSFYSKKINIKTGELLDIFLDRIIAEYFCWIEHLKKLLYAGIIMNVEYIAMPETNLKFLILNGLIVSVFIWLHTIRKIRKRIFWAMNTAKKAILLKYLMKI